MNAPAIAGAGVRESDIWTNPSPEKSTVSPFEAIVFAYRPRSTTPDFSMHARLLTAGLTALLCLMTTQRARAQSATPGQGFSVSAYAGAGLDGSLEALGREVTGLPVLAGAELTYRHVVAAGFSGGLAVGGMHVRRDGRLGEERFSATAWRLTVAPELGYRASERLFVSAGAEIRSAADLLAFDARYEDNVRTHVRLGGDYRLGARVTLTAAVSRLVGSPADIINLVDPGRSVRLGLRHSFGVTRDES